MGFAKTAVADIAAELRMSPANVYRFFPSKNAIVEAICRRCLAELEGRAWAVARSHGSASGRLERLFLEIVRYNQEKPPGKTAFTTSCWSQSSSVGKPFMPTKTPCGPLSS
jgi:AcrR family transcriptional regulator